MKSVVEVSVVEIGGSKYLLLPADWLQFLTENGHDIGKFVRIIDEESLVIVTADKDVNFNVPGDD